MKIVNKSATVFVRDGIYVEPGEHTAESLRMKADAAKAFKEDATVKAWIDAGMMEVEGVKAEGTKKETTGVKAAPEPKAGS